jgi:hypothetical protein
MVFMDPQGFIRYSETLSCDPKVIVMWGRDEDLNPTTADPPTPIKYAQERMQYK